MFKIPPTVVFHTTVVPTQFVFVWTKVRSLVLNSFMISFSSGVFPVIVMRTSVMLL